MFVILLIFSFPSEGTFMSKIYEGANVKKFLIE